MNQYRRCLLRTLLLLHLPFCAVLGQGRLRGATEPAENVIQRALLEHPVDSFVPLKCNEGLDEVKCKPWSSVFGGADESTMFNRKIVIPCGQCIQLDHSLWGRDLVFNNGLDVQGKLVFPPEARLRVKTTFILVQGELHIFSNKAINGIPTITVTWMDPSEATSRPISFRPREAGNLPCGTGDYDECDIGERPFVVAGGKVVIRGLPSGDMPTWVPLLDYDRSKEGWEVPDYEYQVYHKPSSDQGCPSDGVLVHHKMTEAPPSYISGSWGAFSEWTGSALRISRRSHSDHGLIIDLREIRHCVSLKSTYLLTLRLRLPRGNGPTQCAETGKHCMEIHNRHRNIHNEEQSSIIWKENQSHESKYGEEIIIHTHVKFTREEFDETNAYQILHLRGASPGEDIEVLELTLEAPPREAFADHDRVCADLVPANGKADLFPVSAFPFRTNSDYVQIRTASEHGNPFFRISGRKYLLHGKNASQNENWNEMGIAWSIPPSCAKAKATYRFRAKVRVHSETPIILDWNIRGVQHRRGVYNKLATCPPSSGEWVQCNGGLITLSNDIVHSLHLEVLAETLETFMVDYDVDDMSFELVDGPVDRLVLPNSIHNYWVKGAHLLISSSSPQWDSWDIVQIKEVKSNNDETVHVEINRPIQSPVTSKESEFYPTEISLLSRNILFENGSHFTILHTPGIAQIVQGADFDGWGSPGIRDRYPIHFDDCQDADGTIISRNTIRNSRQRGIVLHATNNVRVEWNVAFNVTGHTYALESGGEIGNVFDSNLGVYTLKSHALMPQMGESGKETDDMPATFWITNPMNSFHNNAATGSEGHGFWWQLREAPQGPHPQGFGQLLATNQIALGNFENNVVHSVGSAAVRFANYHPRTEAKLVSLRVFFIAHDAFEVSDSEGISVINGVFDESVDTPRGLTITNPSLVDVRGCTDSDEEAIASMNGLAASGLLDAKVSTPTAPSVFGLQEFHSR